jgi:hypothetical protein
LNEVRNEFPTPLVFEKRRSFTFVNQLKWTGENNVSDWTSRQAMASSLGREEELVL